MKYIVSLLVLVAFFGISEQIHAAPRMSPFQKGAEMYFNSSDESKYIRSNVRSYYSKQRDTSYSSTNTQRDPKEVLRLPTSANKSGSRMRSTTAVKAPIVPMQITRDNFETVRADNIPFYFSIPAGFEKVSDNLEWDSGKLRFAKSKSYIEILSTGERCDGGVAFSKSCLYEVADKLNNLAKTNYPNTRVAEDKTTYLQYSTITPRKNNLARSFISENSVEKIYKLTFTDPVNGFVWGLKIYSENSADAPLSQESNYRRIIASLFQKGTKEKTLTPRTTEQSVFNYKRISSQRPVISRLENNNKFDTQNINFQIEVPKGFSLKTDTLNYDNGEMILEGGSTAGGSIKIIASDKKCDFDTSALMRRCIEKSSKENSDILWFETPGVQFLQEENLLFKPTFNQKTDDVGRIFIARVNKKRLGVFTFVEPIHHHLWTIEMETAESKDSFINDMREIRRIITSMYFK